MPSMNRSMSVPDTGSMWDMHTSASQPAGTFFIAVCLHYYRRQRNNINDLHYLHLGSEANLWDITMNPSTQGPTIEQLQKVSSGEAVCIQRVN